MIHSPRLHPSAPPLHGALFSAFTFRCLRVGLWFCLVGIYRAPPVYRILRCLQKALRVLVLPRLAAWLLGAGVTRSCSRSRDGGWLCWLVCGHESGPLAGPSS